jgi:hypothetical protein
VIGRLFGRKPSDDEARRSADRLITSREAGPAVPPDARASESRSDAALDAAADTVSLSPIAQALPVAAAAPAAIASAAPIAPVAPERRSEPVAPLAPAAPVASADLSAAYGRQGGSDPWIADAFDLLLAEEQGEAPAALYAGGYGLSEADLDRIAARVADRLTRGALGDSVTRIVTEVSERLVREEIERIRQSVSAPPDRRP